MNLSMWQWLPASALLLCLGSFGWAMRRFFAQPAGVTLGMKVTKACGIIFGIAHFAAILLAPISPERAISGFLLYLAALGLFGWAISSNWQQRPSAAFSPDLPTHLVAQGPYRFIRHPFYCSYLICWFAGIAASGRLWLLPTFIIMLVVYLIAAAQEEGKFLRSALADDYRRYCASTGLLLPNPWKLISARSNPSWNSNLGRSQNAT